MKKKRITPALIKALGTMSDFKIAAEFALRPAEVKKLRLERNIPSVAENIERQSFRWSAKSDALLGKKNDREVARKLNTSNCIVRSRRIHLGIARFEAPLLPEPAYTIQVHHWTEEEDAMLGTDFDTVIAEQMGINTLKVSYRRNQLEIEPYQSYKPIVWTEHMLDNLGEITDRDFAEYFEISLASVFIKRVILQIPSTKSDIPPPLPHLPAAVRKLLGVKTDKKLSERFNIHRIYIRLVRTYLGIPPAPKATPVTHFKWKASQDALLGTMSDNAVSLKIGLSPRRAQYRRHRLGIPVYQTTGRIHWSEQKLSQLGRSKDTMLAQQWKVGVEKITRKRKSLGIAEHFGPRIWTKKEIALLGTASDETIANKIGLSASAIRYKRRELEIGPFSKQKKIRWSKKHLALLGTIPDAHLAYKMQVNPCTVLKKRIEVLGE